MVLDLVAGVIVSTDFIRTESLANRGTSRANLGVFLVLFDLPEFGAQQVHGDIMVLLLGAFLADRKSQAGGFVKQANGSGNFVDILAAMAAGARGGNINIFGIDDNLVAVNLGKDNNRGSGGVDPAVFFGKRNSLDAVSTGFVLELAIGINAADFDDVVVDFGYFPANFIGVANVHGHQVLKPQIRFFTAGPGRNSRMAMWGLRVGTSRVNL